MVLKASFFTLLALLMSHGEGKSLPMLLQFLEKFDFQYLDSASIDFIKVEMADLSDETISVFIDKQDKFVKPLSLETEEKEHTNRSTLHIVPVQSIVVNLNKQNCQFKGKFIKESYKSYLVFGDDNIFPDEKTFMNNIKCYFPYQPYVYTLTQKDSYSYNLYELQIVSQKSVQLATWNNSDGNMR